MTQRRDTIVVGTSAGGTAALRALLGQLDDDLPAAVSLVQHLSPESPRHLVSLLASAARLTVDYVDEPQPLRLGHVHVAAPNQHLVIADGSVLATRGPRENRARPAINPLFRTAAAARGGRVIAVLLTGMQDDGVAGLAAVKRCSGVVVVQDPGDAEFPELPRRALESVAVDHVVPISQMGDLLARLAREDSDMAEIPEDIALEASLTIPGQRSAPISETLDRIGRQVPLACPECGGPLWQIGDGPTSVYRCHTGHVLTDRALLESQAEDVEQSLWAAVRALAERATLLEKLAADTERRGGKIADSLRERARETRTQAERARQFLLSLRADRVAQGHEPE